MPKQSLMLIQKKKVTFKDGAEKMKHVFMDENNVIRTGWSDIGEELSDELVSERMTYDASRAREYNVDVDEYEGKMRFRVDLTPQRS